MDPRVCAASLRSLLRPWMTTAWVLFSYHQRARHVRSPLIVSAPRAGRRQFHGPG